MAAEEARRLATLRDLDLVERELSDPMKDLLAAAELALEVQGVGLALVDEGYAHLKMRPCFPVCRVPRRVSFAELVMEVDDLVVVEDTLEHPRLQKNSMSTTVRFLAGVPLRAPNGLQLGAFVAADYMPLPFGKQQGETLRHLGRVAESLLQLQALDAILLPGERDAPGAAGLPPINLPAPRLSAAPGVPAHLRPNPEPTNLWAQSDPELVKLLFKKGAGEILTHLFEHRVARFKDLLSGIPGMNQRTLTTRLRELEGRRLISRQSFLEIPPRVEYSIAPDAQELVGHLVDLFKPTYGEP